MRLWKNISASPITWLYCETEDDGQSVITILATIIKRKDGWFWQTNKASGVELNFEEASYKILQEI